MVFQGFSGFPEVFLGVFQRFPGFLKEPPWRVKDFYVLKKISYYTVPRVVTIPKVNYFDVTLIIKALFIIHYLDN